MRIRAALALLLAASGCSTTYRVPKTELARLDGWYAPELVPHHPGDGRLEEPESVRLRDVEGREHPFTEETPLVLVQNDGSVIAEKYLDLRVDAERFRGVPQDAFRKTIEVPLGQVKSASIRQLNLGRTLLLCGGVALGLVGALVGYQLAIGTPVLNPPPEPCSGGGCQF
jgi:hypothetical protein